MRVNSNFVPRPTLEKRIRTILSKSPHTCILQGIGGSGKTEMARHFALSMKDKCHVFWIDCRTMDAIISDFTKVATILVGEGAGNLNPAAKQALSDRDDWFMVVDNIDNMEDLTYVREHILPRATSGKLFITGRVSEVSSIAPSGHISMPTMELESILLLEKHMGSTTESDLVKKKRLVELLGHLPLAIEQAGRYIQHTGNSLERYIMLYSLPSARVDLLGYPPDTKWSQSVLETFEISFNIVSKDAKLLLYFMAYLGLDELTDEFIRNCTNYRPVGSTLELQVNPKFDRGVPLPDEYLEVLEDQNRCERALNELTKIALLKRVDWNLIIHPVGASTLLDSNCSPIT